MNTRISPYPTNFSSNLFLAFFLSMLGFGACANDSGQMRMDDSASTIADSIPPIDSLELLYITGHFDPAHHPDFAVVPEAYASRGGLYLRKETLEAFRRMYDSAMQDGVQLRIVSATRNFNTQKDIWEAKWNGDRLVEDGRDLAKTTPDPVERALAILRYSSMPGTSRHHWGSDMDLNNLTNEYFAQGEGLKIYTWLQQHAYSFGFCQPYTAQDSLRPTGYQEEKWHWSYLPVAQPLTIQAQYYLSDDMINGFLGAETADSIHVVQNYVLGVNQQCKELPE